MPSLPSPLLAAGVPTNQGVGGWGAGSSYLSVDEGISAADGVEIGDNSNATADVLWYATLTDTPGLLDTMDTISVQTRYRVAGAQTNNRSLFVRIETDEATPVLLTNEVTVATNITTTTLTNSAVTAMTIQGTPTKTQWDNAVVRYRLAVVKNKGGDTNGIRMDTFEFTGTYTAAVPSRAETLNTGGGISATVTGDHSVAASVRTGGNITTTAVRDDYSTSVVSLGMAASTPYYDALDVWIRWRVSSASLAGLGSNVTWTLREGETYIAGGNFPDVASTSFINSFASLTPAEAASIGVWSNLRLRISFAKPNGSGYGYMEVADAWLSIPATVGDPSRTGELNTGGGLTATVTHDASKTGTIRSGGGITATSSGDHATSSTLNGGGGITSVTTRTVESSGVVNGGGGISAVVTRTVSASVTVNGGGGIAATTTGDHASAVAANTGGGIATTTSGDHTTTGSIRTGGRISASLGVDSNTSGIVNGGGGISATTAGNHVGSGSLRTGGGLSSVVAGSHATTGTLNTGGGVDTTTAKRPSSSAQVRGGGRLVPVLGSSRSTTTSIRSGPSITATVIREGGNPQRAATLNAGGGITASASRTGVASTNISGGGGVTAQTTGDHAATGLTRAGGRILATASQGAGAWPNLELALAPVVDPLSNRLLPHFVHFRYRSESGTNAQVNWWLMCGATEITSGTLLTSTTSFIEISIQLVQGEIDLITDYSDMRVRLERPDNTSVLLISDIWFEVPLVGNPFASVSISTGGGITSSHTSTHIVEAFPSPANAMLGPAMQSGGGITASLDALPQGQGILNTGGGISASVTSTHSVAATISGGGQIIASTAEAAVQVEINGGGRIVPTLISEHTTSVTMQTGGGINAILLITMDISEFPKPGGRPENQTLPPGAQSRERSGTVQPRRGVGRILRGWGHGRAEPQ